MFQVALLHFCYYENHMQVVKWVILAAIKFEMLADYFYWPKIRNDVERFVQRCITCHKAKSKLNPNASWKDISMDMC